MTFYGRAALGLAVCWCAMVVLGECAHLVYDGPSHMQLTHKFAHLPGSPSFQDGSINFEHHRRILAHDRLRFMRKFKRYVLNGSGKMAVKAENEVGASDRTVKEAEENANRKDEKDPRDAEDVLKDPNFSGGGTFPLYGSAEEFGLYYTKIGLGNPPQEYNVMIDTGSHLLWVDCEPCYQCPASSFITKLAPPYDPSESSSSEALDCSTNECVYAQSQVTGLYGCESMDSDDKKCYYNVTYGDGSSTAGYILKDDFEFSALDGTKVMTPITFGCGNFQTGNLYRGGDTVDGLIGLAKSAMSIPSQFYQKNLSSNVFAHCLGGEKNGGLLVFGKIIHSNVTYTPIVSIDDLYSVKVVGLTRNGTSLPGVTENSFASTYRRDAIIDSGTTLAYIPDAVFTPWITLIMNHVKNLVLIPAKEVEGLTCWEFEKRSYSDLPNFFPNFVLHFDGGGNMNIFPSNYLIIYSLDNGDNAVCIAWRNGEDLGLTLLGEIVLRDRLIIYDREVNQIGWMDHDCSNISVVVLGKDGANSVNVQDFVISMASITKVALHPAFLYISILIPVLFSFFIT